MSGSKLGLLALFGDGPSYLAVNELFQGSCSAGRANAMGKVAAAGGCSGTILSPRLTCRAGWAPTFAHRGLPFRLTCGARWWKCTQDYKKAREGERTVSTEQESASLCSGDISDSCGCSARAGLSLGTTSGINQHCQSKPPRARTKVPTFCKWILLSAASWSSSELRAGTVAEARRALGTWLSCMALLRAGESLGDLQR